MNKVPVTALTLSTVEMKAILIRLNLPATQKEAAFEASVLNQIITEQGDPHIKQVTYFKANRLGTTLLLTRPLRAKIFREVENYVKLKFNNYLIQNYGYC